jgi:hypothetical protein
MFVATFMVLDMLFSDFVSVETAGFAEWLSGTRFGSYLAHQP